MYLICLCYFPWWL